MATDSLQTSKPDLIEIFPSLKELAASFQEEIYVPRLKDVGFLDAPKHLEIKLVSIK